MSAARKSETGGGGQPASQPSYAVDMTRTAEEVYRDLFRKARAAETAGHPESLHCTNFRMIQEVVRKLIPLDPHSPAHALRGELSNLFRIKKGRWRIIWIASSAMRRVCILFISETMRKEGDPSDPYEVFLRAFESGKYDAMLEEFGVRKRGSRGKT